MVLDAAMHRKGDAVVQSENILSKVFYPLFQERGIHGKERDRSEVAWKVMCIIIYENYLSNRSVPHSFALFEKENSKVSHFYNW